MSRGGSVLAMALAIVAPVLLGVQARCSGESPQATSPANPPLAIADKEDQKLGGPLVPGQIVAAIDLAGRFDLPAPAAWTSPLRASACAGRSPICGRPAPTISPSCSTTIAPSSAYHANGWPPLASNFWHEPPDRPGRSRLTSPPGH